MDISEQAKSKVDTRWSENPFSTYKKIKTKPIFTNFVKSNISNASKLKHKMVTDQSMTEEGFSQTNSPKGASCLRMERNKTINALYNSQSKPRNNA